MNRKITGISLTILLLLAVSGCADKGVRPSQESARQQAAQDAAAKEQAVMADFAALVQKEDVNIAAIIQYIDENAAVSPSAVSTMVIELEKLQQERLPELQDKFSDSETVQKILAKSYWDGLTSQTISSIDNKDTQDLLLETQNSGFKVETAEGMYFPVIDYSVYKKYRNAATPDIAAFIDIMTVESDKTPIKDAALMIGWNEILSRALTQEEFIRRYSHSAKAEDMRRLLKRYAVFALYGANNTPLFSYDTKKIAPEAQKAYVESTFDVNHGRFSKAMNGYLSVLKRNDYQLTDEVQEYRNKAAEEIH
ncbi:hypothetical protein [Acetonema longum]|uniref:Lipoprotein n=1 Tax=Acetonema longum DSM 6540 TaxID=1009370 RepID=F7NGE8_9FIRM|nr:hypothetical protein [Acetonema longum]EGO64903.1 hypothetical protein ALO_05660 [Acetonema longum DSM 6540]